MSDHSTYIEHLQRDLPEIQIIDDEIISLGQISPGCRACHAGTWDCIFLTMACNLHCPFCISPQAIPAEFCGSAFGATPEAILHNHARTKITGISFSGGEVFTQRELLFVWLRQFRTARPDAYLWLYTNGLLVTRDDLLELAACGLDEMRFNLAATGYTQRRVLDTVAAAAEILPAVTIEIPAIPQHRNRLLAALDVWDVCGIQHLNLHELMHEPGTAANHLPGERVLRTLPDGHVAHMSVHSRDLIREVLLQTKAQGLHFSVNACLLQTKIRQIRGRRNSLRPFTQQPHESFDGTHFHSVCVEREGRTEYVHPEAEERSFEGAQSVQHVRRLAPLEIKQRLHYEVIS